MAPVQGCITHPSAGRCCDDIQALLDDPKPLDVGEEQGKAMLLSCPGFPPQTNPGSTPLWIPVSLLALPPCRLLGNISIVPA